MKHAHSEYIKEYVVVVVMFLAVVFLVASVAMSNAPNECSENGGVFVATKGGNLCLSPDALILNK